MLLTEKELSYLKKKDIRLYKRLTNSNSKKVSQRKSEAKETSKRNVSQSQKQIKQDKETFDQFLMIYEIELLNKSDYAIKEIYNSLQELELAKQSLFPIQQYNEKIHVLHSRFESPLLDILDKEEMILEHKRMFIERVRLTQKALEHAGYHNINLRTLKRLLKNNQEKAINLLRIRQELKDSLKNAS